MKKEARMNRASYFFTMLFALPALSLGNAVAYRGEFGAGFAALTSLALICLIVAWSIRRLRDAGQSAWWSFGIIPPATIVLLGYNFFAPSSTDNAERRFNMYGIRAKGFWRITAIVLVSLALLYLIGLYATFLTDTALE